MLSVVFSLLVGSFLVVAPWTGFWEGNYLLAPHPVLRMVLLNPFVRGSVSGLGLVNILLALHEARQAFTRRAEPDEGGDRA